MAAAAEVADAGGLEVAKIEADLVISDGSEKWGLVEVYDDQGNLARSYPITLEELQRVQAGGVPPLLDEKEWHLGRASVSGRPCLRGMMYVQPDGSAIINRGTRVVGDKIEQSFGIVPAEKWAIRADQTIEVDDDIIAEATVDPAFGD